MRRPLLTAWLAAALLAAAPAARADATPDARLAGEADAVLATLQQADFAALAGHTCAGARLAYAPYARNLTRLATVSFTRGQVAGFAGSARKYTWGRYDGSGEPIVLTPREYHAKFVYDRDYRQVGERKLLEPQALRADPELRALARAYPGAQAVVYRYPGKEELGFKDARELILVFRNGSGPPCLRGIAHSEDTV